MEFLWQSYGKEDDSRLTEGAKQLKQQVIELRNEVERRLRQMGSI